MNSSKQKSRYFQAIRAKKLKAISSTETDKDKTKDGKCQRSISCYFSLKSPEVKQKEREENGALKRKLQDFNYTEDEQVEKSCKKPRLFDVDDSLDEPVENIENESPKKEKKLTPLEQQVKSIKEKYSDTLLMVECGYRYRFFGDDAEKAAKVLDIIAHEDSVGSGLLGLTASVPTFNGHMNYVRKLALSGEKVGIMAQTESSAEKKANQKTSSSGPFTRDVTELYTASTYLEDLFDERNRTFAIMAISKHSCLILVPVLGRLTLTKFDKKGLRDVLNNNEPFEIICDEKNIEAINQYLHDQRTIRDNPVRFEVREKDSDTDLNSIMMCEESDTALRQAWPGFNKNDVKCFHLMHDYLKQFNLENLIIRSSFDIMTGSNALISSNIMKLPQMTIDSLELDSLLKIVNNAKTKPGKRLFKVWMLNPITIKADLEQRYDAVEYLIGNPEFLGNLRKTLAKYPFDFEIALASSAQQKISDNRFKLTMNTFSVIGKDLMSHLGSALNVPSLLNSMLDQVIGIFTKLPKELIKPLVTDGFITNDKIKKIDTEIAEYRKKLDDHRTDISSKLGMLNFKYCEVAGVDYLIEVKNGTSVPSDWTKINATKKFSRYRTPLIVETLPKISWQLEIREKEIKKSWIRYLSEIIPQIKILMKSSKIWATLDVIVALSSLAEREGFCRPKFSSEGDFKVRNSRNLIVEESLLSKAGTQFVPNDIDLNRGKALVLTGPNMGGKSCYLRQVGMLSILAQMGSYVPASEAILPIFDALFVRMGARDDIQTGKSTFFVELEETSLILNTASKNSLVLLDELGRGTSTHDGTAIARSVLNYLLQKIQCITLFVTHFKSLANIYDETKVVSAHMGFMNEETDEDVLFLYKLTEGTAKNSFGTNVAKMAGISENIVKKAADLSDVLAIVIESTISDE